MKPSVKKREILSHRKNTSVRNFQIPQSQEKCVYERFMTKSFINVGPRRFFRIEQRKHSSTHYVFLAAACKRSN